MSQIPFTFTGYDYDPATSVATFRYEYGDDHAFVEKIYFAAPIEGYNKEALSRALFLSYVICGASYYKSFPSRDVVLPQDIDAWQANFFDGVYQDGLSQFAFDNKLSRGDLAHFIATGQAPAPVAYDSTGVLALQSGGKDSLLTAQLLKEKGISFTPWYVTNNPSHPAVLDELGALLRTVTRTVDVPAIKKALAAGGLNGHVPVTYMVMSYALIDAILHNENTIIISIGHEGEEPYGTIQGKDGEPAMDVRHQWSKIWQSELNFAEYVKKYVSPNIRIGSPLRGLSELRIAELFATHAWERFGHQFSSCNRANYLQGTDNTHLKWCGTCAKCANSFLLFAPFLDPQELASIFDGKNLLADPSLTETFRGFFGLTDTKEFECIGETTELQRAYHMARERYPDAGYTLPFDVPTSSFDYKEEYDSQRWAKDLLFQ